MKKHYDFGVIGFWFASNYGSLLNGYATYKILKSFGCSPLMINKPNASLDDWELINTHNVKFVQKFYSKDEISPSYSYDKMKELNQLCGGFCAASDQIWNYALSFNMTTFLNFADDDKKKISFASSFGHADDYTPQVKKEEIRKLLSRFDAISVREQSGVKICESYGIKADEVLEPVFCIEEKYFNELAGQAKFNKTGPYMLTYILDPTPEKRKAIEYYGERLGIKTLNILDSTPHKFAQNKAILNLPNILEDVYAEDLVKAIMNAEFVITDSFSGTAFSIIYNKPFISLTNYGRGATRFGELLDKLNLTHRLVNDLQNIPEDEAFLSPIDYFHVNKIIIKERRRTLDWFKNAIETPREKRASIFTSKVVSNIKKEDSVSKHYDIGVIDFWFIQNYGSILNGYAIYKIIKSFGYSPFMINKPNAFADDWELVNTHNARFFQKFYDKNDISPCYPYVRLSELNQLCDSFCVGSNQVWNHNLSYNMTTFLNFADDNKKKISFASSFGHSKDNIKEEKKEEIIKLLSRFNAISVREKSGVKICEEYGVKADEVLEPVFCLEEKYFIELAEQAKFEETEPYMLTYILDPTPEKRKAILFYRNKLGLKIINILDGVILNYAKNKIILNLPNILENAGAEDFVKAFMNASFVITDSFNGTVFSIIFNKPFISITNYERGADRFIELLDKFNLKHRLILDPQEIPEDEKYIMPIDYLNINKIITKERERTVNWFRKAIETPIENMASVIIKNAKIKTIKEQYKNKHYDLGIVGWWYNNNYGANFTYYALHKVLVSLGYSVLMLNEALGHKFRIIRPDNDSAVVFAKQNYEITEQYDHSDFNRFNDVCDIFLCGSDQLWNPLIGQVNTDLFLDFVDDNHKKIAYATSFGQRDHNPKIDLKEKHSKLLQRFDHISVREDYAPEIAKKIYDVKAKYVIDPVFFLEAKDYEELLNDATLQIKNDFLLAFILDPNVKKKKVIDDISKKLKLNVVVISNPDKKSIKKCKEIFKNCKVLDQISHNNFIYAYKNSKYVITDSFHGSCFCYIFRKNFSVFYNNLRGSHRFESLFNLLKIKDRRILETMSSEEIKDNIDIQKQVDYRIAEKQVKALKKVSLDWLKNALKSPKEKNV